MSRPNLFAVCGIAVLAVAVTACGSDDEKSSSSTMSFNVTDTGCDPATASAKAGELSFAVKNSTGSRAEFEIVTAAPSIVLEKFLAAGASGTYDITLPAGDYRLICGSPLNDEGTLTLTGSGGADATTPSGTAVDQAALDTAVASYTAYVNDQVAELQTAVTAFTDAVRAGDVEQAKQLYTAARVPWEAIEPVAELFPDSDAVIDSRADDYDKAEADPDFSGFHALEYGLWAQGTKDGANVDLTALANRLDSDIAELIAKVKTITIAPQVMTNGAGALIEEASQGKITGEEDRYSKTDLTTLAANVDGSQEIFNLLQPLITAANPQLATDLQASFAKVNGILATYEQADGTYTPYDQVPQTDIDALKTAMAQLSEELSQITGSLGLVVAN